MSASKSLREASDWLRVGARKTPLSTTFQVHLSTDHCQLHVLCNSCHKFVQKSPRILEVCDNSLNSDEDNLLHDFLRSLQTSVEDLSLCPGDAVAG